jgi:hypothetical protein
MEEETLLNKEFIKEGSHEKGDHFSDDYNLVSMHESCSPSRTDGTGG